MKATINTQLTRGLQHTWLIDLDGTLVIHNGHLRGGDSLLPGTIGFFDRIPADDKIIILTARDEKYRAQTHAFLSMMGLRHDLLIMGLPTGERILINDRKPDGTNTAYAINVARDNGLDRVQLDLI